MRSAYHSDSIADWGNEIGPDLANISELQLASALDAVLIIGRGRSRTERHN